MTTFDRYLLRRYWHVFAVGYLALFGLYFVIDVFTNVTDFLDSSQGTVSVLVAVAQYYSYRACYFFGLIGGTLEVVAAMVALVLMQKHGELNPVLSAGISTFRLIRTLLVGAVLVDALIVVNQELVIPRIAIHLQVDAGQKADVTNEFVPQTDFATDLLIAGRRLNLRERKIEEPSFTLRPPKLSQNLTTISAREASPYERGRRHIGWLLKGAHYDDLQLTNLGKKKVRPGRAPDELLILTDVGFDRLYNGDSHYEFLSTAELIRRLRNPSFNHRSLRSQNVYLQARVTKPILNLIVVCVGVPFVVRKESTSLITNLAICSGVMGAMLGINELFTYLGKVNLLSVELAVWSPIIVWGTAAAWFAGFVRT